MTPQRAKELLPVIAAFAEGKEIQSRIPRIPCRDGWMNNPSPDFTCVDAEFRVKPEPREFDVFIDKRGGIYTCEEVSDLNLAGMQKIRVREVIEP